MTTMYDGESYFAFYLFIFFVGDRTSCWTMY